MPRVTKSFKPASPIRSFDSASSQEANTNPVLPDSQPAENFVSNEQPRNDYQQGGFRPARYASAPARLDTQGVSGRSVGRWGYLSDPQIY